MYKRQVLEDSNHSQPPARMKAEATLHVWRCTSNRWDLMSLNKDDYAAECVKYREKVRVGTNSVKNTPTNDGLMSTTEFPPSHRRTPTPTPRNLQRHCPPQVAHIRSQTGHPARMRNDTSTDGHLSQPHPHRSQIPGQSKGTRTSTLAILPGLKSHPPPQPLQYHLRSRKS